MAWVTPDSASGWTNSDNARDDNTGTYASSTKVGAGWGTFIVFGLTVPISCSSLRFWCWYHASYFTSIDLDAYWDGAWHDVYQGAYADKEWVEKELGGTYTVEQARARIYYEQTGSCFFFEFDFWEANAAPTAPTSLECEEATNPTGVTDLTPEFTAVLADPDSDDLTHVQILVNTTEAFDGVEMWDSGSVDIADCTSGQRCAAVSYAGTALALSGIKYYWKIRAYDGTDWGEYSAVANFTMDFVLLSGTSVIVSLVVGSLTQGKIEQLTGTSAVVSSIANAPLAVIWSLSGTSAVVSSIPNTPMLVDMSFSGTSVVVSLVAGSLTRGKIELLTGTSAISSSVDNAILCVDMSFSGTSAAVSSIAAALLEVILSLSGTSAITSALSSPMLNVVWSLSGTATVVSLTAAYMRLLRQYITGTVDFEHDNAVVAGTNTLWLQEIVAGDLFKKKNEDALYVVNSVDSDEQITLASKYVGDSASGAEYIIHRRFTTYHSLPLLSAKNDYHAGDTDWAELMRYNTRKIDKFLKALEA